MEPEFRAGRMTFVLRFPAPFRLMSDTVASVAQLVEHRVVIPVVEGSSPFARPSLHCRATIFHLPFSSVLLFRKSLTVLFVALLLSGWAVPAVSIPLLMAPSFFTPEQAVNEPHPFQYFKSLAHRQRLAQGKLLIATPQIGGGTFSRTVILLLDYNPGGAMGLILNRPTAVPLVEVLPEVEDLRERPDVLHFGGPVSKNQVFLLHGSPRPFDEESAQLIDGVYVGGNPGILEDTLQQDASGSLRFRVYAGYAGWTAGQLDNEVLRGDWQVHWGNALTVFETSPIVMWKELLFLSESHWAQHQALPLPHAAANVMTLEGMQKSAPELPEFRLGVHSKFSCRSPHMRL